jgi:glycosyltransferase involved in cell wall biosynthesis
MLRKIILNDLFVEHQVISLTTVGVVGELLKNDNIRVIPLGLNKINIPIVLFRLIILLRKSKPDIVQTWMYHSDLVGGIAAKLSGIHRIFWNIRNTEIPQKKISATGLIIRLCSILSYFIPEKIICCANAAKDRHVELGYDAKKMIFIPNGYEIINHSTDFDAAKISRSDFCINNDDLVIGVVGRYDYLKGYDIFIEAASHLINKFNKNIVFLCVGRNVDLNNKPLTAHIKRLKMESNFRLVGEVYNVIEYFSLMDIFCLPSRAEGFPNVVAEAMLASLPCVVTDVGDASIIVDREGIVVPPSNPLELSNGLIHFLKMNIDERISIGTRNRARIIENYDINLILQQYNNAYAGGELK